MLFENHGISHFYAANFRFGFYILKLLDILIAYVVVKYLYIFCLWFIFLWV